MGARLNPTLKVSVASPSACSENPDIVELSFERVASSQEPENTFAVERQKRNM